MFNGSVSVIAFMGKNTIVQSNQDQEVTLDINQALSRESTKQYYSL